MEAQEAGSPLIWTDPCQIKENYIYIPNFLLSFFQYLNCYQLLSWGRPYIFPVCVSIFSVLQTWEWKISDKTDNCENYLKPQFFSDNWTMIQSELDMGLPPTYCPVCCSWQVETMATFLFLDYLFQRNKVWKYNRVPNERRGSLARSMILG